MRLEDLSREELLDLVEALLVRLRVAELDLEADGEFREMQTPQQRLAADDLFSRHPGRSAETPLGGRE